MICSYTVKVINIGFQRYEDLSGCFGGNVRDRLTRSANLKDVLEIGQSTLVVRGGVDARKIRGL